MSTRCQTVSISDKSALYLYAQGAETREVGKEHKISVPAISIEQLRATLGATIVVVEGATICQVKGFPSPRIYKLIKEENFQNGAEIRVSEIAGRLGVGPAFYGAASVQNGSKRLVVLEMDYVGRSLGERMTDFAQQVAAAAATSPAWGGPPPFEVAVKGLYGSAEAFYCALFRKVLLLAEHKIALRDGNITNIIPRVDDGEKDVMLIDYGQASVVEDEKTALRKSISDSYYGFYYRRFESLEGKSEEGKRLLGLLQAKLASSETA